MTSKELVTKNISWLLSERVLRILLSFPVGVLFARYLGPEEFGKWNIALSIIAIINIIPNYASSGLVPKLVLEYKEKQLQVLLTTGAFRLVLSLFSMLISALIATAFGLRNVVFILAFSYIFQSFNNIEFYFHSIIKSKYAVIAKNGGFVAAILLKVIGIYFGLGLSFFAIAYIVEFFISFNILFIFYRNTTRRGKLLLNKEILKHYIRSGFHLLLSGMMSILYMKVDQLMIGKIIGDYEVGIYSVAVRISELFYMIPTAVCSSLLPVLIARKKEDQHSYEELFKLMYSFLFWFSAAFSILISIFGNFIINLLYGVEYTGSSIILVIHVWAGIAVSIGIASSQYLIIENKTKYSFYRTLIGLVSNLILNLLFILQYGGKGAAIASLVSYTIATYVIFFFKDTRAHVYLMFKSINPKYILKYHELL